MMSAKRDSYIKTFTPDDAPGLDAIGKSEQEIYGEQEPHHWATILPYELGGEDPLWAVNCYTSEKQQAHFHYVSLGFTNLFYDQELAENEVNGFGFELTFRHLPVKEDPEKPIWPVNMLQNIAKYVFSTGNTFNEYHYMSANGPLRSDTVSDITAVVFCKDPELREIDTPHGHMLFLQLFGITTTEYNDLREKKYTVPQLIDRHRKKNPLLITDLSRR